MVGAARRAGLAENRSGGSALGCLIPLLIITIIGYLGMHASDAAFTYYRFRDAMQQEARFAHRRTDEQIRERLQAFVDSLDVPAAARKIHIDRRESGIRISADYTEAIEFPFFTKRFDFHPRAERRF